MSSNRQAEPDNRIASKERQRQACVLLTKAIDALNELRNWFELDLQLSTQTMPPAPPPPPQQQQQSILSETPNTIPETPENPSGSGSDAALEVHTGPSMVAGNSASHFEIVITAKRKEKMDMHFTLAELVNRLLLLLKLPKFALHNLVDILDHLDRYEMTQTILQLHPDIEASLRKLDEVICSAPCPETMKLRRRLCDKLAHAAKICGFVPGENVNSFREMVQRFKPMLHTVPAELLYLVDDPQQLSELISLQNSAAELAPHECFERCRSMRSVDEFKSKTNVRQLVAAEFSEYTLLDSDDSAEFSQDETIVELFSKFVPLWQAWQCTLLKRILLVSSSLSDSADKPQRIDGANRMLNATTTPCDIELQMQDLLGKETQQFVLPAIASIRNRAGDDVNPNVVVKPTLVEHKTSESRTHHKTAESQTAELPSIEIAAKKKKTISFASVSEQTPMRKVDQPIVMQAQHDRRPVGLGSTLIDDAMPKQATQNVKMQAQPTPIVRSKQPLVIGGSSTPIKLSSQPDNVQMTVNPMTSTTTDANSAHLCNFDIVLYRPQLLKKNFRLRKIAFDLLTEVSGLTADSRDVDTATRLMDKLDDSELEAHHWQLHWDVYTAYSATAELIHSAKSFAQLIALKDRALKKCCHFMTLSGLTKHQFIKQMKKNNKVLCQIAPKLVCLANTKDQLERLLQIPPVGTPLPDAINECYEYCRKMRCVAQFRDGTNVCELVEAERAARGSDDLDLAEESYADIVEVIFNDYVPSWHAWHVTLLKDIRLVPKADQSQNASDNSAHIDIVSKRKRKLKQQNLLHTVDSNLTISSAYLSKDSVDPKLLAHAWKNLDSLDELDWITKHHLQVHPNIIISLRDLTRLKSSQPNMELRKLIHRARHKLFQLMDFCNFIRDKKEQFFNEMIAYKNCLRRIPLELAYLTTQNTDLESLGEIVAKMINKMESSPTKQNIRLQIDAMATAAEFTDKTNISELVSAVLSTQIDDDAPDESINETISAIFKTYVPIEMAWYVTLLKDLRLNVAPPLTDEPKSRHLIVEQPTQADYAQNVVISVKQEISHSTNSTWQEYVEIIPQDSNVVYVIEDDDDDSNSTVQLINLLESKSQEIIAPQPQIDQTGLQNLATVECVLECSDSMLVASNCTVYTTVTEEPQIEAQIALPAPNPSTNNTKVRHQKRSVDADRTVILKHDFAALPLVRHTTGSTNIPKPQPVPSKRQRTAASTSTDHANLSGFEIEDASLISTRSEEDTNATLANVKCTASQRLEQSDKAGPSAEAQPQSQQSNPNKQPPNVNQTHPAIVATSDETANEQTEPESAAILESARLQQYLKLTDIQQASFDLTDVNENDANDVGSGRDNDQKRTFSMRVLFRSETDWWTLDENAVRILLHLPDENQWRAVRLVLFQQRRFEYNIFDSTRANQEIGNTGKTVDKGSVCERIIRQLFATRCVEQAGLTVVSDWSSGRAQVLRMADMVRSQLRDEQLQAMSADADEQAIRERTSSTLAPYVMAGLKRMRRDAT